MGWEWKAEMETTGGKCLMKVITLYASHLFTKMLFRSIARPFCSASVKQLKHSNRAVTIN